MFQFWLLGCAWLMFAFSTACDPAVGANADSAKDYYRKDCNGTQYDIQDATCCENKLHPGASLSCCGNEPYNPGTATCCQVQHGHTITASVTQGLSEKVSNCCDLKAYNPVNEICCQSTIRAKPSPMADCCDKEAFDVGNQLCCGPAGNRMILMKNSSDHRCCGHNQHNTKNECCCSKKGKQEDFMKVQPKHLSCCVEDFVAPAASLCGNVIYDKHTHLCCELTVIDKPSPRHRCCDKGAYDDENELCCGPFNDKKILQKKSRYHGCCIHGQYNNKTECCCWKNNAFQIQSKNSSCCVEESASIEGVQQQTLKHQPKCTEPNAQLCGSSCYNPKHQRCCERNQSPHWFCSSGQSTPTVYNPRTQICCDGCISLRNPSIDHCCGETPYGLAQRGVLCCNNTLYKDREDGEECSEMGIPHNPAKRTMCGSQFHPSPGERCCGTEIYQPQVDICCNGHRHPKSKNNHCCGVKAYNIKDPQMKCCTGTLYNVTSLGEHGKDAQCCGSILQKPQEICCSSEDKEMLYSAKTGFRCCGHLYYNTTLWSCCAGRLSSIHKPESGFLSVNNLNKTYLCKEMYFGEVESVSLHNIVFRNVLKIRGKKGKVKALPFSHILRTDDRCSSPKLIPGKTYFFNKVNVFTDLNHNSFLQSLHFIVSKCSP